LIFLLNVCLILHSKQRKNRANVIVKKKPTPHARREFVRTSEISACVGSERLASTCRLVFRILFAQLKRPFLWLTYFSVIPFANQKIESHQIKHPDPFFLPINTLLHS